MRELQSQQQDDSATDTGNGGITDEQLRQYLEELLGPAGPGSGQRPGFLTSCIAHIEARGAVPPARDSPLLLIRWGRRKTDHLWLARGLVPEWPGQLVQIRINLGQLGIRFEQLFDWDGAQNGCLGGRGRLHGFEEPKLVETGVLVPDPVLGFIRI